jgi:hypothetical protein
MGGRGEKWPKHCTYIWIKKKGQTYWDSDWIGATIYFPWTWAYVQKPDQKTGSLNKFENWLG